MPNHDDLTKARSTYDLARTVFAKQGLYTTKQARLEYPYLDARTLRRIFSEGHDMTPPDEGGDSKGSGLSVSKPVSKLSKLTAGLSVSRESGLSVSKEVSEVGEDSLKEKNQKDTYLRADSPAPDSTLVRHISALERLETSYPDIAQAARCAGVEINWAIESHVRFRNPIARILSVLGDMVTLARTKIITRPTGFFNSLMAKGAEVILPGAGQSLPAQAVKQKAPSAPDGTPKANGVILEVRKIPLLESLEGLVLEAGGKKFLDGHFERLKAKQNLLRHQVTA